MSEIRNTKQKKIILDYLKKHENEHLTIEKIKEELKNEVGEATIYRMIKKLSMQGIVTKIPLSKQGFWYNYCQEKCNCVEHLHLVCEKCGHVEHIETDAILMIEKKALEEGFEIEPDKLSFYGICKECRR